MLNMAVRNTNKLIREVAASENLRIGRFFTKKAEAFHMASLFTLPEKDEFSILDAGAGTGILSAAAVEALGKRAKEEGRILRIHLTCYENNPTVLPMLHNNVERIRKRARTLYGVRLFVTVKEEDFMAATENCFDLAVANPPSALIEPDKSLGALEKLCQGETDLAYLFACKAFSLLAPDGQSVFLLPNELSCGVYLENIRRYLLSGALTHLVLSDNGERGELLSGKAAAAAPPFQKHMALHLQKGTEQEKIAVLSVNAKGEAAESRVYVPSFIIRGDDRRLLLLRSHKEEEVVRFVEAQKETLSSLGLKMKTGLTLASRHGELLRSERGRDTVPLLRPCGMSDGHMRFPIGDGRDYIVPRIPSLRQPNKNLLLIKRVPTKKDGRQIVAAVYYASQLSPFSHISTDNKLNFIDYADGREMSMPLVLGLYALFSSSLYDGYLKITGGVRRVNASLYDTIPLPSEKMILEIGRALMLLRATNDRAIDATVTSVFRKYSTSFR